jgi:hypothetical protein
VTIGADASSAAVAALLDAELTVWQTATADVPALKPLLEPLIAE